jgi:hypothetical protein
MGLSPPNGGGRPCPGNKKPTIWLGGLFRPPTAVTHTQQESSAGHRHLTGDSIPDTIIGPVWMKLQVLLQNLSAGLDFDEGHAMRCFCMPLTAAKMGTAAKEITMQKTTVAARDMS